MDYELIYVQKTMYFNWRNPGVNLRKYLRRRAHWCNVFPLAILFASRPCLVAAAAAAAAEESSGALISAARAASERSPSVSQSVAVRKRVARIYPARACRGARMVLARVCGCSMSDAEGASARRWPAGILRRSGARAARSVLRVKYHSVPPSPSPSPLPLDLDDTVSCFCRKARRKEREGEPAGGGDPKLYLQEALLERKLPELDMRQLVELPHGLDYNEWLASHTLALFEHVNLLYGTVSEFCSGASCPDMTGPAGRTYAWYDERGKKCRVAAPQYVDYVMTFIQKTINDETIFPTKYANEFPAQFESAVRRVLRLLFHVVAHMYAAHFRELALLRLHAHLHLTFAHLTALDARYALLDHKETDVLRDLERALRLTETPAPAPGPAPASPSPAPAPASPAPAPSDAPPVVVTQPLATA